MITTVGVPPKATIIESKMTLSDFCKLSSRRGSSCTAKLRIFVRDHDDAVEMEKKSDHGHDIVITTVNNNNKTTKRNETMVIPSELLSSPSLSSSCKRNSSSKLSSSPNKNIQISSSSSSPFLPLKEFLTTTTTAAATTTTATSMKAKKRVRFQIRLPRQYCPKNQQQQQQQQLLLHADQEHSHHNHRRQGFEDDHKSTDSNSTPISCFCQNHPCDSCACSSFSCSSSWLSRDEIDRHHRQIQKDAIKFGKKYIEYARNLSATFKEWCHCGNSTTTSSINNNHKNNTNEMTVTTAQKQTQTQENRISSTASSKSKNNNILLQRLFEKYSASSASSELRGLESQILKSVRKHRQHHVQRLLLVQELLRRRDGNNSKYPHQEDEESLTTSQQGNLQQEQYQRMKEHILKTQSLQTSRSCKYMARFFAMLDTAQVVAMVRQELIDLDTTKGETNMDKTTNDTIRDHSSCLAEELNSKEQGCCCAWSNNNDYNYDYCQ